MAKRPTTPRKQATRATPADVEATEALRAAGGVCARCEQPVPALIAVEVDGALEARCLSTITCTRRLRASLAGEDGER